MSENGSAAAQKIRAAGVVIVSVAVAGVVSAVLIDAIGLRVGLLAGIGLGALVFALIRNPISQSVTDFGLWCSLHGFTPLEQSQAPPNAPFRRGDAAEFTQLSLPFTGSMEGADFVIYNCSHQVFVDKDDQHFTIVRIRGPRLPVSAMSIREPNRTREIAAAFKVVNSALKLQEHSLESVEFNKRFELRLHETGDGAGIRGVFDPATINACASGELEIPPLYYYDESFWFIFAGSYGRQSLDFAMTRCEIAARAACRLARAPAIAKVV